MKKIYSKPNMDIINIASQQQLLAGSLTENPGSAPDQGGGSFGSRMDDEWDLMLLGY